MDPTNALIAAAPAPLVAPDDLRAKAGEYLRRAKAEATLRAYRTDWLDFLTWCREAGRDPLPAGAETVVLYLTARSEALKVATLQRRLSAISQAHQSKGYDSPTRSLAVRAVWAGIRRTLGVAQHQVAAAVTEDIRRMVESLDETAAGVRDRALILVGFAGAFRRSELVSLDRADVEISRDGLVIQLRKSKTDQEGQGVEKGIPYGANPDTCPVRALEDWAELLDGLGYRDGPLFRAVNRYGNVSAARLSDRSVALIVKRLAAAAGLDADRYSGHSLRAGFATSAGARGVEERHIMAQTGHKSERMVRRYIRRGGLFRHNAAGQVGL